eukprot:TRINITY_DN56677_c0_g1_i1.p1 TRINITY_DN56677_c0_g1~~TRINITY_DN56677_c0_g1_i1.p1  ORF type:complete len:911 (-),score=148.05 TRINITY_DN56677_c0_g1_i1:172-2904(-)
MTDSQSAPLVTGVDSRRAYGSTSGVSNTRMAESDPAQPEEQSIDPALFRTGKGGLTSKEAHERLARFGPNELPEREARQAAKLFLEFVRPMPLIIWAAIFLEVSEYVFTKSPAAALDALVLFFLQFLNVIIGFWEELKAGEEVTALKASLKPEACVIRDGKVRVIDARTVVLGDRVCLTAGAAVPADCRIDEGEKPIQVDQAAMTGESLPVTKFAGAVAKMGSTLTRGESEAVVVGTGANTFFGKTAALINTVDDQPHFEMVLDRLLIVLVSIGLIVCAIILFYLVSRNNPPLEVASFVVVLLIASIPVALRVVCTCTLALGCKELAEEKAIVARLSAVEEFAGMDILCSDKTGTLTQNKMVLQDDLPLFDGSNKSRGDVLTLAALATKWWEPPRDALDALVLNAVNCEILTREGYKQIDYIPFDPVLKRTEAVVQTPQGQFWQVMKGAPQVVLALCDGNRAQVQEEVEERVLSLAQRGIRALAVASAEDGGPYRFLGILTFLDPPRPDTRAMIERARELGVDVKMITGDHHAIAVETSRILGLGTNVVEARTLPTLSMEEMAAQSESLGATYGERFEKIDGFSQLLPEHKYLIVEGLRQRNHLVGMTGDGVNDAPALKRADVGIAVSGATNAAQAASDIVLTQPGLSTIVVALFTSRKIFQRMKNFVIYRVACTEQLLFFFFFSTMFFAPNKENPAWTADFFSIPVIALVSITILNDGTIVSVAYDNVNASVIPEKWNLTALYIVSSAIGVTALASSLLLLRVVLRCGDPNSLWRLVGLPELRYAQIQTVMYLKISLSDYVSVFNSRCQGWMWSRAPSKLVLAAACFAMIVATLLSLVVPPDMEPIETPVVGFVWAYVMCWAFIQDAAKVATYAVLKSAHYVDDVDTIAEEDILNFKGMFQKILDFEGV